MRGPGRITQLGGTPPPVISATAAASALLTLTTDPQDIVGATLSLVAGTYLVFGVFDAYVPTLGDGSLIVGSLNVGGTRETQQAHYRGVVSLGGGSISQVWRITLASTTTVKLQARKAVDTGVYQYLATHTTITAIRTQD